MTKLATHKRLRDMRDEAIRRPSYRPVYLHALGVAHMSGCLVADDHPAWASVFAALSELRARMPVPEGQGGDSGDSEESIWVILDRLERELMRLRD